MSLGASSSLWFHTVRHLRFAQVVHRARLRSQLRLWRALPAATAAVLRRPTANAHPWPADFVPFDMAPVAGFPSPELNAKGAFEFLNERREECLDDWNQPRASLLWRYHLHYFEWAWAFAAHEDREWAASSFESLWTSWRDSQVLGRGTAWAPYVASLRTWVLCGVYPRLAAGRRIQREMQTAIGEHAGFVRAHVELDVGGNHLIKNLKALVGAGIFLNDDEVLSHAVAALRREAEVQILVDGGHYERSPSYHCQVLGDFVDITSLLAAAQQPVPPELTVAIEGMRRWLGTMLLPDGDVPFFNDCATVGRDRIAALAPEQADRGAGPCVLPSSGYVVAGHPDGLLVVFDAGPPCPPELPAHAHSDCLSFELCVDGTRAIVNSGVSTYEAGERREYERSTRAHNTIVLDDHDQTETWGQFRAARRASALLERCRRTPGGAEIVASHDGFTRLTGAPRHRRHLKLSIGELTIVDEIEGAGAHSVASWLHLTAETFRWDPNTCVLSTNNLEISVQGPGLRCELVGPGTEAEGYRSRGFGRLVPAPALVARVRGELPLRLTTTIKTRRGMPTTKA